MIQGLIDKGYAYATPGGDVYFRVHADEDYGKLSRRKLEEAVSGTRVHGERGEDRRGRLRAVEGGQAGRADVGQPVGRGPAGLAHRVLGDEPAPTWASRSTSTAAATT